jgi:hypothetical protein
LKDNPRGVSLCRDEIGSLFTLMRKTGYEMLGDLLLEGWNASTSFKLDRIGRGTTLLEAPCISVFGTAQPSRLKHILKGYADGGDGLLSRFQFVVFQESKPAWRPSREPMPTHIDNAYLEFLVALADQREGPVCHLHLSNRALDLFEPWQESLQNDLNDLGNDAPALESHVGKLPSLVLKLAGILHLAFHFEHSPPQRCIQGVYDEPMLVDWPKEIGPQSMQAALDMARVLRAHAEHLYRPLSDRENVVSNALLKKVQIGKVQSGTKVRDIKQSGWSHLDNHDDVELAVSTLERNFILRVDRIRSSSGKGRPSDIIVVNPKVHQWGSK